MKNLIAINNNIYKLKAKDMKRLSLSSQTEKTSFLGNKLQRFTTEDTDTILLEILDNYKPIGELNGLFDV